MTIPERSADGKPTRGSRNWCTRKACWKPASPLSTPTPNTSLQDHDWFNRRWLRILRTCQPSSRRSFPGRKKIFLTTLFHPENPAERESSEGAQLNTRLHPRLPAIGGIWVRTGLVPPMMLPSRSYAGCGLSSCRLPSRRLPSRRLPSCRLPSCRLPSCRPRASRRTQPEQAWPVINLREHPGFPAAGCAPSCPFWQPGSSRCAC